MYSPLRRLKELLRGGRGGDEQGAKKKAKKLTSPPPPTNPDIYKVVESTRSDNNFPDWRRSTSAAAKRRCKCR